MTRRLRLRALRRATPLAAAAAALASGCATGPVPALESAESSYQAAASDPEVTQFAPVALHDAETALDRARAAWGDDADRSEVEHLSYLASQRVEIARAHADRKQALATAEQLGEHQQVAAANVRAEQAETRAEELSRELETLRARETERGLVLDVDDVLFAVDRAALQPGVLPDLARLASFLEENPERPVYVEGHTDSTGSSSYNLELSQARAQAVADVLLQQGVPASRIHTQGFGESQPIASNATAAGRQDNRRVEIVVANPPSAAAQPPR